MKVKVNGINLYYSCVGEGQPLLLLHGNGESSSIFKELTEELKPFFKLYLIDSRNHGQSDKTADYSYETMTNDVYEFIKKFNLDSVSVLGFSDGAIIGLLLALRQPDLLKNLILLGGNLSPKDFKDDYRNDLIQENEINPHPLYEMMLTQPNIKLSSLKKITSPILFVAGEDDLFKDSLYDKLQQTLPNAHVEIMPNHDHESYIVHSTALFPVLCKYFQLINVEGKKELKFCVN